jgi:hypothetical protein
MNRFKDVYGRFVPPREWELSFLGLALLALGSVPLAWILHGSGNVREPRIVVPIGAVLVAKGLWLRRKRLLNSQPIRLDADVG